MEKKKRWRPSLTAYRALEAENADLRAKCEFMERQLKGATADYNEARKKVLWLIHRNLWERIINKTTKEGD